MYRNHGSSNLEVYILLVSEYIQMYDPFLKTDTD